ncbi:hypothetical protein MUG78_04255 [Gordonia alkaliphila]|uniref:hypothetical protein n=1 Tax=Gordonia alkaliphila TaxID=1053547 RepID=UPI001FF2D785|nr:hypothetical protein [Gordonia alkaliphila]MCK0438697.1 hypothetical protein [Gordonia alkaliphila]
MNGSHRKPSRRTLRRAQERRTARVGFNKRKIATAAGAAFISASIAMGPAVAQAQQINAAANAQHDYDTWNNLIIVSDALGQTQRAILAPLGSIGPDGMFPSISNTKTTESESLDFLSGVLDMTGSALDTPDTSHVPGAGGVFGLGGLVAGLPQYAMVLPTVLAAGDTAVQVMPKPAATVAALLGVDATTLVQNGLAAAGTVWPTWNTVDQDAGYVVDKLDLGDPLGLLGLPDVQHDRNAWNHAYNWPLLQIDGKTWLVQERYAVDPVTSESLKQNFRDQIGTLDTLDVRKCVEFKKVLGVTTGCKAWSSTIDTTYNPNPGVENALNQLNGIDVPGFSLTKREAGGQYNAFGDSSLGWLMSTTQVIVGDQVTTVPVLASGIALPFGLFTTGGQYSPGMVSQNGQTISGVLGSRSQGWSVPVLGVGANATSVLESFQIGPDGIAYNSGWTIAAIDGLGIPVPLVYSMGSFNFGPQGIGYTSPSFFGVGLPSFQLGDKPDAPAVDDAVLGMLTGALGSSLPTSIITLDPAFLLGMAGITDPTGLGLLDPFGTGQKILDPIFRAIITPPATLVFQGAADLGTAALNATSKQSSQVTGVLADLAQKGGDTAADTPVPTAADVPGDGQQGNLNLNQSDGQSEKRDAQVVVEPSTTTNDLLKQYPMEVNEAPVPEVEPAA